ncbi:hypothetical protein H6G91_10990 [Nostoc muscorum FACHB-395]|jgi:sRNA-binding regulator protein Hfq|nr:hypothetical protein [Desmonostoc muscorum FACHB-395]
MNVESWHFLVSRNRSLDYRTVVAPDFICEAKIYNLLARVADGDLTESKMGFFRQVIGSKAGDFTIAFRVIKATGQHLNPEGKNEILKDSFGREIYLIEGVVLKGIVNKKEFFVTNKDIEEAHELLMTGYKQFWEYSEPTPAIPSHKFSLSIDSSSTPLQLEELEPFQVSSKSPNPRNKSKINFVTFLVPIIPIVVLLMLAMWLTKIVYPFGKSIVGGCTTTQEVEIVFNKQDKINETINKKNLQKDYPKADIFLNGSLKVESSQRWKSLQEREKLAEPTQYTIRLNEDNSLQMRDHPIDLAIAQLRNQKVSDKATIQARIIEQKECTKDGSPQQG